MAACARRRRCCGEHPHRQEGRLAHQLLAPLGVPPLPQQAATDLVPIRISMDGRGRWMDNVFIERLWRSLKYECVYLHAFETGSELRAGLTKWIGYYNANRPHSGLGGQTPDEA